MGESDSSRRDFLKRAAIGGGAVTAAATPLASVAQDKSSTNDAPASPGYMFLIPSEAAFIEAVADHMFPADAHTPGGVDIGINIFIDRALAGSWGKGDRLYLEGPWRLGALDKIE
jgi:gluconate 2-dehydrogenase gamma chain